MELQVIAHARNGFEDKFGIPRQSRDDLTIETRIVFTPTYRVREALRGIEGYSHLWLLWHFDDDDHEAVSPQTGDQTTSWSPTVRPPRLGGNKRIGVFATRSPNRPNRIALSSVRLLRVEQTSDLGLVLVVSGADMMDGTEIYDIKPYLSFSDSHPDATNGFADDTKDYHLEVQWSDQAQSDCLIMSDSVRCAIEQILSQDPRPAYQHDPHRLYTMDYDGWKIQFRFMAKNTTHPDGCIVVVNASHRC